MRKTGRSITLRTCVNLCSHAQLMGKNLYLLIPPEAIPFALPGNSNARGEGAEELLIPLCSGGGATLGCIRLSSPRDPNAIDALQLSRIEMLAADLAVAVALKALHTQLGRSEKLAALGELLAGVARMSSTIL
jgi:hypothetical protein